MGVDKEGQFLVSASCMTFSNRKFISSSETRVHFEQEAEKCKYLVELNVRKPVVASFTRRSEKLRLQPGLEFDKCQNAV